LDATLESRRIRHRLGVDERSCAGARAPRVFVETPVALQPPERQRVAVGLLSDVELVAWECTAAGRGLAE
jgi:hypothetical protein